MNCLLWTESDSTKVFQWIEIPEKRRERNISIFSYSRYFVLLKIIINRKYIIVLWKWKEEKEDFEQKYWNESSLSV